MSHSLIEYKNLKRIVQSSREETTSRERIGEY